MYVVCVHLHTQSYTCLTYVRAPQGALVLAAPLPVVNAAASADGHHLLPPPGPTSVFPGSAELVGSWALF